MKDIDKQHIIKRLKQESCSCIIVKDGIASCYYQHGVRDLYDLLNNGSNTLNGAFVADKVVGKGAAALMILGGVSDLHAEIISTEALKLIRNSEIICTFATEVTHIINRTGTDICPVERQCLTCATAAECLPKIKGFFDNLKD